MFDKYLRGLSLFLAFFLLFEHMPLYALAAEPAHGWAEEASGEEQQEDFGDYEELYTATIGDAWTSEPYEEPENEMEENDIGEGDTEEDDTESAVAEPVESGSLPEPESLYESTVLFQSLSSSEQKSIVNYMDSNMVGAPYNYTGGYTNTKAQGWCCAGAVSRVLFYAYDCRELIHGCDNPSWVPSLRNSLDGSAAFEKVYDSPQCFVGKNATEVDKLFAANTQAGDIIIFYGPRGTTQPHCGIAGGGNALYSALVHTGFAPTTISYYACSTSQGEKSAGGMAVFRKKTVLGKIRVCKSSALQEISDGISGYSMAGATYIVSASKTLDADGFLANPLARLVIEDDEDNVSSNASLAPGSYYVQELKAPSNGSYLLNKKVYGPYQVTENRRTTVGIPSVPNLETLQPGLYVKEELVDVPQYYTGGFSIEKKGALGEEGNFEGAEFTVRFYDGLYSTAEELASVSPMRTWVLRTDQTASCSLSEAYLAEGSDALFSLERNGERQVYLPYGTIYVTETKAPAGFRLEQARFYDEAGAAYDNGYLTRIENQNGEISLSAGQSLDCLDYPARGDLAFRKVRGSDGEPMENIPFLVTSKTTGESHVLVSGADGYCSTHADWVAHTERTNENDGFAAEEDSQEGHEGLSPAGVWFYGTNNSAREDISDTQGALPLGVYVIQELPCENNMGMVLLEPFEVNIDREHAIKQLPDVTNLPFPTLKTRAWDKKTQTNYAALDRENESPTQLVDTVSYQWLSVGEWYTVKGCLADRETGEVLRDKNGAYIQSIQSFRVEDTYEKDKREKCGSLDMTYDVLLADCEGKAAVFYEYLFAGQDETPLVDETGRIEKENALAEHQDREDREQTIFFSSIGTEAFLTDGEKTLKKTDTWVQIKDVVTYQNLIPGETYRLCASLMYQNPRTGEIEVWRNPEGTEICGEASFVPEEPDGSVEVLLEAFWLSVSEDGQMQVPQRFVVYERLFYMEEEILSEESFDKEAQTIIVEPRWPEEPEEPEEPREPLVLGVSSDEPEKQPEPAVAPKTGDVARLRLALFLGLFSAGGIVIFICLRKRGKEKK